MSFEIFDCCTSTREDKKGRRAVFGEPPQCGVGIIFQIEDANQLVVRGFVKQGAAAKSGMIKEGDILKFVDGEHVAMLPSSETARLMYGPMGSEVKLGFLREDTDDGTTMEAKPVEYEISLVRSPAVPQTMHLPGSDP